MLLLLCDGPKVLLIKCELLDSADWLSKCGPGLECMPSGATLGANMEGADVPAGSGEDTGGSVEAGIGAADGARAVVIGGTELLGGLVALPKCELGICGSDNGAGFGSGCE
jgi:hypothetical protein